MELPWLEKYRPKSLDDVVGNEWIISKLKQFAKKGNIPNLLMAGSAGVGKTTSMQCLSRALLGKHYKKAVLELNASDERGIDTVRNKIKIFAQTQVTLPPNRHKIIILDEADNITSSAQNALRRTMEIYSDTTRFILSCNISSKIIEAIQSRCTMLRFTKLDDNAVHMRMMSILDKEKINSFTKEGLEAILFLSEGDLRNAINTLQATLTGFSNVTPENVYKICDLPHPVILKKILSHCTKGETSEALDKMNGLVHKGYLATDIISSLFRVAKTLSDIDDDTQLEFIKEIGFVHMRALEGVNSKLQLNGLVGSLSQAATK